MAQKSRKFSTRILLIVLFSYIFTSFYYIYNLYTSKIEASEKGALERLESISNTLASQINGTMMKMILEKYENKDEIKDKYADPYIREIVEVLERTVALNKLPTDIYTLTYDSIRDKVFFGIASAEKQYFRHEYQHPPLLLKQNYHLGAVIPMYKDENGTWLSAFTPLKDNQGNTVAVVQTDLPFDKFIEEARSDLWLNVTYNLLLLVAVTLLLFYWLRILLQREENIMKQLSVNNEIINKKNEDITASIAYAQRIQQSLMDSENKLKSLFASSFLVYEPKDIVSGDFYWIQPMDANNSKIAVAVADCTGHGVPGALVSVLGITFLRDIVSRNPAIQPNEILEELNLKIINTFQTKGSNISAKDGMDIAVSVIDQKEKKICFSGAYRPLLLLSQGELKEFGGDKQPIGSDHFERDRKFTNKMIDYKSGDWIYMFTDGYVDQFGGDRKRKFMKKNFKELLLEINGKTCNDQAGILRESLTKWKGETEQVDDITVLGLQIP